MVKRYTQGCFGMILLPLILLLVASVSVAGDLAPQAGPDDPDSAMFTLEDAYNRLDTGVVGEKRTDGLTEPSAVPGSSGYTIDEVMAEMPVSDDIAGASPGDVVEGKTHWGLRTDGNWGPQTGTSTTCATCTGTLSAGGRWCDQGDGTVKDMTTGLVWLRDAGWGDAYSFHVMTMDGVNAHDRASNVREDYPPSLSDGSVEGDWRLPTREEAYGLINGTEPVGRSTPRFFINVHSDFYDFYWTSSRYIYMNGGAAWFFDLYRGDVSCALKHDTGFVWPVRCDN